MKLKIAVIGKLKSGPERELFTRYLKRAGLAGRQLGISDIILQEFSGSKAGTAPQRKQIEAKLLLSTADKGSVIFAFDENGSAQTSSRFAHCVAGERDNGTQELILILGGADGLGRELLEMAKFTIRFGKMTWPHQIARVLLAEQLYRTMTILSGHPYHRP